MPDSAVDGLILIKEAREATNFGVNVLYRGVQANDLYSLIMKLADALEASLSEAGGAHA